MNPNQCQPPATLDSPKPAGRRNRRHPLAIAGACTAIVIAGGVAFAISVATKPEPKRQEKVAKATVVETEIVRTDAAPVALTAMGTVVPARSVTVFPQVSGKLVHQSPNLVPGGLFRAGEVIAQIDPRDYDLAVRGQAAAVSQAQLQLAQERGLKAVADHEWAMIEDQVVPTEDGKRLALRELQVTHATAAVDAARAQLEGAELQRSRTTLRAPFNAIVLEEFVDVGQVVGPATQIATLVDSDRYWVRVSVPMDRLHWVAIPGVSAKKGSEARVVLNLGGAQTVEHRGQVIRLLGDLDPKGMMARVLVEVLHPLGAGQSPSPSISAAAGGNRGAPLLLGAYVKVHLSGPVLDQAASLSRTALRDSDQVWVANGADKLEIRRVEVIWSDSERVFVTGDVRPGERAITSRIAVPVDGMDVKIRRVASTQAEIDAEDRQPATVSAEGHAPEPQENSL